MRALAGIVLLAFTLSNGSAEAAGRAGLRALSPDATRAVISYGVEWVEVDLATGATELIVPTVSCSFTSAVYAPEGGDMALAAHCSVVLECAATRASLFTKPAGGKLNHILTEQGVRWNAAYWRRGAQGDDIILRETGVSAPLALRLNELGGNDACAAAPAVFTAVSVETGRTARLDYLPKGWTAVEVLAAPGRDLIAAVRARDTGADIFTAEAEVAAICNADASDDWRLRICGAEGHEIRARWSGGDWQLYDGPGATPLRRFIADEGRVTAEETCDARQVGRLLETDCRVTVTGPDGSRVISAPDGLFGDLRLSANGRWLASLVSGRGFARERFDLFDLQTGEQQSLSHLLALSSPWDVVR